MSMLRTLARREQITDIVHLHSAPTESDVMFAAELSGLERGHDGYRLRLRSTRTQGRLDLSRLDDEVPDWRERQTWACGPEGMLDFRRARLVGRRDQRPAAPGALRRVESRGTRTGRHGRIRPQRQNRHRGRRHAADGRRRGRRRADAVRLPDGHLPILCRGPARRACPRPAYGCRTRARFADTDVHIRSVWAIACWTSRALLAGNLRSRRLR